LRDLYRKYVGNIDKWFGAGELRDIDERVVAILDELLEILVKRNYFGDVLTGKMWFVAFRAIFSKKS